MEIAIGNCSKHPGNNLINCQLCALERFDREIVGIRIIGEYMGWTTTTTEFVYHPTRNCLNGGFIGVVDYNLLMEVVEKIERGNYGFKMCRKVVEIYFDDSKDVILKKKESSRIESLYAAIIDIIPIIIKNETP